MGSKKSHTTPKKIRRKRRRVIQSPRKAITVFSILALIVWVLGLNYAVYIFESKPITFTDDFFIDEIVTQDYNKVFSVGKIKLIEKPNNLPKFKDIDKAIDFVKNIPYDRMTANPSRVLLLNRGNCLGKARLLYYLDRDSDLNSKLKFKKYPGHITVEYLGKEFNL